MLDVLNKIDLNSKRFGLHRSRSGEATAAANVEVNDCQKHGRCKAVLIYLRYLLNDIIAQSLGFNFARWSQFPHCHIRVMNNDVRFLKFETSQNLKNPIKEKIHISKSPDK